MSHSAYIFDFDGTLVDSMPCWSEKMLNILREEGIPYPPDIIKLLATLGDIGTAKYFREEMGVALSTEEMFAKMDAYALPRYRDEIPAKAGVEDYLRLLKASGRTIHVLTASPHKMLDPCLKRLGLYNLFDNVWSCDDFGTTKADPAIYRMAVERIGVLPEEAAFFDDNANAVKTAASAGLYTVGVYDASGSDYTAELKTTADHYIHSFTELAALDDPAI